MARLEDSTPQHSSRHAATRPETDMPNDDLLFLPASRAAALIRNRKLSRVEYTNAIL